MTGLSAKKDTIVLFYPASWPEGTRGRIPYALLYLERMIRDLGLRIILIDEQVTRDYREVLLEHGERLLLAGVSVMTGEQIRGGIRFSEMARELSSASIVWGGWHPSLLPEETLREPFVDYVVIGQGECTFRRLVETLRDDRDPGLIPGIGYKSGGGVVTTPVEGFRDINLFPRIDLSLVDINEYVFRTVYSDRCLGYFCSHGCPYSCAFCCVANVYGRRWYRKGIDEIVEDLCYFKETAQIKSVTFDDDNFFVDRDFAIEFCHRLIASGLDLLWDTSAHAGVFLKKFSDEDVALFRRSGCRQIYIGAESGDQRVLDRISKGTRVEDNLRFVELLHRHDIVPMMSTMICFPQGDGADVSLTLDMLRRAKLQVPSLRARIFFYTPYPGTELYEEARQHGFVPPERLADWPRHTLRKFRPPWSSGDCRRQLEIFANFYFPLADSRFYQSIPVVKLRPLVFLVNKLFYPLVRLRMRRNFFRWPVEAVLFLGALRLFNRMMGTRFCLGYESYLD